MALCYIPADKFWGLTAREITDIIAAENTLKKQEYAAQNHMIYNLATLISLGVNNPRKYPSFNTAFGEKSDGSKKGIPVENWRESKAAMEDYAYYFNNKGR